MQVAYSSEQKEVNDPSLEEMTRAAIRLCMYGRMLLIDT